LPALVRRHGPVDAAAIIVSNVIGGGILFTPALIAAAVPSAPLFLALWLAGGVLALAGAMAYAELAALRPQAGGEYVYLRDAFGKLAAFLTGWTSFVAGFSGAIAASAVVTAVYLGRFVPAAADDTAWIALPVLPGALTLALSPQRAVALAVIAAMAAVHVRGVGPGRVVGTVLAALKVGALALLVAAGFALGAGDLANLAAPAPVAPTAGGWLLALVAVMFTYSGWNAAAYVAEEIRDPGRNVPRALALGTGVVAVLYVLLNALYLSAVPIDELAAVEVSVLDLVGNRLFGPVGGGLMAAVAIVSLLASLSAMTLAGPRVYYAMARDGVFFRVAAAVHPRYRTPATAIVLQAAWSALLVLIAGADALVTYTGFAIVLFSGAAVMALFVLRAREPDAPRPFRAWGYPIAPGVYVAVSIVILGNALWEAPAATGAGALVIAAGLPLYWWQRKRRTSD
jgi:APA family basic amino acid/polyamine antiporter